MYITIKNLKKTLGKYVELTDLYIGIPSLIIFMILFLIIPTRMVSLIFLAIITFLLIPINLSKKNRMYKVMYLIFRYIFSCKEYIYKSEISYDNKKEGENNIEKKDKRRKTFKLFK